jgi:hypothetical protein
MIEDDIGLNARIGKKKIAGQLRECIAVLCHGFILVLVIADKCLVTLSRHLGGETGYLYIEARLSQAVEQVFSIACYPISIYAF